MPCEEEKDRKRTLDTYVYVILRLLGVAVVFVSFGEGVCDVWRIGQPQVKLKKLPRSPRRMRSRGTAWKDVPNFRIGATTPKSTLFVDTGQGMLDQLDGVEHGGQGQRSRGGGESDLPKVLRFSMDINSLFLENLPKKKKRVVDRRSEVRSAVALERRL